MENSSAKQTLFHCIHQHYSLSLNLHSPPSHEQEMGGYFIVNGIEKVIRMLIMPRRNYPIAMSRPKWKNRGQGYTQYGKWDSLDDVCVLCRG